MAKEFVIALYLLVFKAAFSFFKLFPMKEKVTFTITFGDNSKYIYDEIRRQELPVDVVVLYKGSSKRYFESEDVVLIPFETYNIIDFLRAVYHLATSKKILIDNYFGFLSVTEFKKEVECIQLWHASGAIKKFGLEDQSVPYRSKGAKKRFLSVYEKFDKVIVGSDVMANTFMNAFNLPKERILRTGIPRTDFFYDENKKKQIMNRLMEENKSLKSKRKILYAPTYRDQQLDHFDLKLEMNKMYKELGDEFIVLLRLHPAIKNTENYSKKYPGFVYDYSSPNYDINELLLIADYLITDYSSIPYEFSLMNKPMLFFAYDLDKYSEERGLVDGYEKMVPGPVVHETSQIVDIIKKDRFNYGKIKEYASRWNKYSTGNSSEKFVNYLFMEEEASKGAKRRAL
ncbi:CDP-glycerol glycerophosphotransferase family protein [Bacillus firmus]|uniref:CDP-glycerol glycerophosphotransferase family protein n=1 Tax=Cytobacillus firmus TaxID=1399 RepID=UPI00157FC54B|nr:CDP-glycerol glycerophosphotransferase family protein [Cytobacillus firmus]NUH85498.1 CDP-glycerol glycerophosphotransferase family protein [Cytobacillus firmus]